MADPRLEVFGSRDGPEIFHSVEHRHDIWKEDPLDVEIIHQEAREVFERLLNRALTASDLRAGRILLLKGESGAGKTHLMRAFRNSVHSRNHGYFGYMQMTSDTGNYSRYILSNLISSLEQPYYETETSGLMYLSSALAETPGAISPEQLREFREENLSFAQLGRLANQLVDQLIQADKLSEIDMDLMRALLYLQHNDPRINARVFRYLRCEDLSKYDREMLGNIVPRTNEEEPQQVVQMLGRLAWAVHSIPIIICLDQLEDIFNLEEAPVKFRRAMSAVCAVADNVPSAIIVISCLDNFYGELSKNLTRPIKDRIELDPEPITLKGLRNAEEILLLVEYRLRYLYEALDVEFDKENPTYPIPVEELKKREGTRTRDVLDWCRDYRQKSMAAGALLTEAPTPPPTIIRMEQDFNDFLAEFSGSSPDGEPELAGLLAWAVETCSLELGGGRRFDAVSNGRFVTVDGGNLPLLVGVCNKGAQGGGLGRQIEETEKKAGNRKTVIVRSADYPKNPKAVASKQIGLLIGRGGCRIVVQDSEWRLMTSLRSYLGDKNDNPEFAAWRRAERHLTRLQSLREILDIDHLAEPSTKDTHPPKKTTAPKQKKPAIPDPLRVGVLAGRGRTPTLMEIDGFCRHAAFLGGTGSGKTTLALNIIEQLLLRGIPAILVDRKGDLCGYAGDETWTRSLSHELLTTRRTALRAKLDVALFTPGDPGGRPLSISIAPDGIGHLNAFDREQTARHAASALGGMMSYKSRSERDRLPILTKALCLLSEFSPDASISLKDIISFIGEADPSLVNVVGKLDRKLFQKLAHDLQVLSLSAGPLFLGDEKLNTDVLLGRGAHARQGKTRLSIISTKFLGDNQSILFWVAQMLLEIGRWASKNPSDKLQAVVMFDEADMYLPAVGKPSTREPMENLLKRARSAGLGVFLATQSPGDFDYKCRDNIRTWFVGNIKETTAINKMKPMFNDYQGDAVASKLSGLETGRFVLLRDTEPSDFLADMSILKTTQLSEGEILELARKTLPGHTAPRLRPPKAPPPKPTNMESKTCPHCKVRLRIKPQLVGKRVKCPKCKGVGVLI